MLLDSVDYYPACTALGSNTDKSQVKEARLRDHHSWHLQGCRGAVQRSVRTLGGARVRGGLEVNVLPLIVAVVI